MPKFKLVQDHVFWWPVTIQVPSDTVAGEFNEQRFKARFRALATDDGAEMIERHRADVANRDAAAFEDEFIRSILIDWDDQVVGDDGKPIEFSAENLALAMGFTPFRRGILAGYRAAMFGTAS